MNFVSMYAAIYYSYLMQLFSTIFTYSPTPQTKICVQKTAVTIHFFIAATPDRKSTNIGVCGFAIRSHGYEILVFYPNSDHTFPIIHKTNSESPPQAE